MSLAEDSGAFVDLDLNARTADKLTEKSSRHAKIEEKWLCSQTSTLANELSKI